MEEIKVGIIGHGFMGHEHETMLTNMEGIRVTAIADIDPKQLDDVKIGIKRYIDPVELINDKDVDVVLIVTNNNQHKHLVIQAARAGKDIICEKPAAMSVTELDEMIEECEKSGVKFTIHHQRRLDPDFQAMKSVYNLGLLGNVYTVKNSIYGFNGNMHDWHVLESEGGGMLLDWGVHLLDQMLYMIDGKVKTVFADVRNVINFEVDDYFKILLKFENGVMAEVELGTYYLRDHTEKWFERHWFMGGDKGTAYVDGFRPIGKIVRTTRMLKNVSGERTMNAAGPTRSFGPPADGLIVTEELPAVITSHADYFKNYINAYRGKEEFLVKIPEVRRVLALMEAIRESAKTGKSIDFE